MARGINVEFQAKLKIHFSSAGHQAMEKVNEGQVGGEKGLAGFKGSEVCFDAFDVVKAGRGSGFEHVR